MRADAQGRATALRDILLIAYAFPPDPVTGAARPGRFAKYLSRLGHNVQVISAVEEPAGSSVGNVHRLPGEPNHHRGSLAWYAEKIGKMLLIPHDEGPRWVFRAAAKGAELFAGRQPVILSSAPPLTTHLAAARLKSRFGWKWIADFRDPLTGNPFREKRPARFMDPYWERYVVGHADRILVNTDAVGELWSKRHPRHAAKIQVLWNGFDPEANLQARPLGAGPALLRHVGTVYGDRYPKPLLDAIGEMSRAGEVSDTRFGVEFIGPLLKIPEGVTLPTDSWFRALPPVPRAEADALTASAHYLLLLDVTEAEQSLQVPAKLYDYIRVGRPVVAVTLPNSPVERILRQCGLPCIFVYPKDSPDQIKAKVRQLLATSPEAVRYSPWFEENFDGSRQAARLSAVIQSL